jgi:TPR repeat protein
MTVELGDRTHFADVLTLWEQACDKGSYSGCNAAGVALVFDSPGLGNERDVPRGRAYLAKACTARYLPACGASARIVVELKETSDYSSAHAQLLDACQLRERESCHYLAERELDGTFGAADLRAAGHHFLQACNDGWGASCAALAAIHAKGIGTPVNADKAKRLTSAACALKYQPACDVLQHPDRDLPPP